MITYIINLFKLLQSILIKLDTSNDIDTNIDICIESDTSNDTYIYYAIPKKDLSNGENRVIIYEFTIDDFENFKKYLCVEIHMMYGHLLKINKKQVTFILSKLSNNKALKMYLYKNGEFKFNIEFNDGTDCMYFGERKEPNYIIYNIIYDNFPTNIGITEYFCNDELLILSQIKKDNDFIYPDEQQKLDNLHSRLGNKFEDFRKNLLQRYYTLTICN